MNRFDRPQDLSSCAVDASVSRQRVIANPRAGAMSCCCVPNHQLFFPRSAKSQTFTLSKAVDAAVLTLEAEIGREDVARTFSALCIGTAPSQSSFAMGGMASASVISWSQHALDLEGSLLFVWCTHTYAPSNYVAPSAILDISGSRYFSKLCEHAALRDSSRSVSVARRS